MADNPHLSLNPAASNTATFQTLLRELFQFDCADLDFGIYRIMNHKRDAVEKFIAEQLPGAVAAELDRDPLAQHVQADAALQQARREVETALGADVIDPDGRLADAYRDTPLGKLYLDAQAQADGSRSRAAVEARIYNHLYTFFSRYYQDGDLISKRRYARNERYAIPYNGEEVHLHWANRDQYYVKTAEHFYNYDWNAPGGVAVQFRLKAADVEQNNVKGDRRFFLPCSAETTWDADARTVTVPFEYRPLSTSEQVRYGNRNQQDNIIAACRETIANQVRQAPEALAALTGERRRNGQHDPVSHLEHHLRQYTRRNDSDFFIHKDLPGFLSRELDFYLKNEVLNLDDVANAGRDVAEGWFQQMRLIKAVGSRITDFLAQVEGFQKRLWEKRKFVIETHYCITLGSVDPSFYPDIAGNDAQWDEWRQLYDVDGSDRSTAFLQAHPTLVVDTAHFDAGFTARLLASFDDLDGMTDGLLIHGENWQALRLLEERYRGSVKCIYIDPPYNTNASAIIYKNGYKDSSWLSLMESRLSLSARLMSPAGVLCCAIDDEEVSVLRLTMQRLFARELGIAPVRSNPAGRKSRGQLSPNHEYALFVGNDEATPGVLDKTEKELERYPLIDSDGRFAWNNLIRHGSNDRRQDRPKLFYPIYVSDSNTVRIPEMEWDDNKQAYRILEGTRQDETAVYPVRIEGGVVVEKNWHRGWQHVQRTPSEYRIRRRQTSNGTADGISIDFKIRMDTESMPKTWWDDTRYASANLGPKVLKNLFGDRNFDFAKAAGLVEDCIRASGCESQSSVLDYFAGSGTTGHAVINLNREDGGQRKFILVEMGEYFDTVLLPRIKKVTFSPAWKDGKPQRAATPEEAQRSPRIVKYLRLESYEDALDSIEFDAAGQLRLAERFDDYLLRYMLHWETRGSATLLNVSKLTSPFTYRLRVHVNGEKRERPVDLPETFNYLLGLNVRTRRTYDDGERRYLVYRGETRERPGHDVAVIWRETAGWVEDDFARDRQFISQQQMTEDGDTVYVNGDSCIPGAKAIEPMFKARMFAGVNV